ncbi:hypothetical protein [Streptomyces sp. ISL-100]|uniref:hypothetical protein n=1 Tax=Streptomyces sp. ISL-100 TaxID=2819173 RepID=UPI001BEAC721|nr:hypothetical protein [Streptomyces sp. ISL-100]MBT2401707.1 hypothetical protein [Streptomyces sp. ISL-100]
MYSVPEPEVAERMRAAHGLAATKLAVTAVAPAEAWGWRGRTLSRRVQTSSGPGWLRLVHAPAAKAGGKLWEGPQAAEAAMPRTLPRPRLKDHLTWTAGPDGYLAELYEVVGEPTITADEPILRTAPKLDDGWWATLRRSLDTIARVPTDRVSIRQAYLDRAMPQYLGEAVDTKVPAWSTAHGDLHWADLTGPTLTILDWEGWGVAPAGYDAAMLHAFSLLVPEVSALVRLHLNHILDTPAGRFSELVVITELLQTISRGDSLDLEVPLRQRAAVLLNHG